MATEPSSNRYEPNKIEPRWQAFWEAQKIYQAIDYSATKKYYALVEFPYPSGAGLHIGHVRSWAAMDAFVRLRRMQGFNVLFPMGWDAFGLPAENYALKMGVHPSKTVAENISKFKKQCQALGLSFDWSREINTTDPDYYRWTQWIFLKLFKAGLAYRQEVAVNWCPSCKSNLADEEVLADGSHERCGNPTEKRLQKQWLLRITNYAQRLLDDLQTVDFSPKIRIQQENWIGRKEGINIAYAVGGVSEKVTVFTTRPDTNFGATFIVLSPEHPLVAKVTTPEKKAAMEKYLKAAKQQTDEERAAQGRKKTGVFTGRFAVNPLTGYKMPIWVSDFALMSFGTGAVMGVPGHDRRDFEFAKEFGLDILRVVMGKDGDVAAITKPEQVQEEEGVMVNSGFLNGLDIHEATRKIMDYLEEKGWGKRTVTYHLRDWVFSRQHYWGEPIPVIYCEKCGIVPVPETQLPVTLPYVERYQPSGTGASPLANFSDWVSTPCPVCHEPAKRETDTMPNWAGSNWYFLRYLDPKNHDQLVDKKKAAYWLPVDIYEGGFEHTTLHLLYSRFIHKFLYDEKVVPTSEPYARRRSHGIVLGSDGRKMSKSFGNVISPDEIVKEYGSDTLRLYEMFMGPFEQSVSWSDSSLQGCYRFLGRVFRLVQENVRPDDSPVTVRIQLHRTIKKVGEDLEKLHFNTVVSTLMELINVWEGSYLSVADANDFLLVLAPLAPHLTEELWHLPVFGHPDTVSLHTQSWPDYNQKLIVTDEATVVVQVNGKVRDRLTVNLPATEAAVVSLAQASGKVRPYLQEGVKKVIYIDGKLINFVV